MTLHFCNRWRKAQKNTSSIRNQECIAWLKKLIQIKIYSIHRKICLMDLPLSSSLSINTSQKISSLFLAFSLIFTWPRISLIHRLGWLLFLSSQSPLDQFNQRNIIWSNGLSSIKTWTFCQKYKRAVSVPSSFYLPSFLSSFPLGSVFSSSTQKGSSMDPSKVQSFQLGTVLLMLI